MRLRGWFLTHCPTQKAIYTHRWFPKRWCAGKPAKLALTLPFFPTPTPLTIDSSWQFSTQQPKVVMSAPLPDQNPQWVLNHSTVQNLQFLPGPWLSLPPCFLLHSPFLTPHHSPWLPCFPSSFQAYSCLCLRALAY